MLTVTVPAGASGRFTTQLLDESLQPVPAASLLTATLSLYDAKTGTVINTWDKKNALNANGVTIDASGNVAWTFTPSDMVIVTDESIIEDHYALFLFGWGVNPVKGYPLQVKFRVQNIWRRP